MPASPLRIESRQNPRFQSWMRMASSPQQHHYPWIPVEGWKHIEELSQSRELALLLYSGAADERLGRLVPKSKQVVQLAPHLLDLLSDVKSPQGVLAFLEKPEWEWGDLPSVLLYLENLQDPGNLGTLLRTAMATDAGIVTGPSNVSCFNRKVIRASTTALFAVPFKEGVEPEALARRGYELWAAEPRGNESLYDLHFKGQIAVLIGAEGAGLSAGTLQLADRQFGVPMSDAAESINAAVAGSVILYEVYRQKTRT